MIDRKELEMTLTQYKLKGRNFSVDFVSLEEDNKLIACLYHHFGRSGVFYRVNYEDESLPKERGSFNAYKDFDIIFDALDFLKERGIFNVNEYTIFSY